MAEVNEELRAIVEGLTQGRTATPVTIRTFLSWFGAKRRTSLNVENIERQLSAAGIRTIPNYLNIWVDTPITFELLAQHQAEETADAGTTQQETGEGAAEAGPVGGTSNDPSFRIGRIASANNPPLSVKPNASLKEAVTIMLARNFSQLPVMSTERNVKGVISWASIGTRLAAGTSGPDVQSYMDDHQEIPASASLFRGIRIIIEHNYVLVRAADQRISGIVTSNDISLQFEEISTPFLLLAEIENHLRALISGKLNEVDIRKACGDEHLPDNFTVVSELTFGNYVRILDNPDNWTKLGLQLDRKAFCAELAQINSIRNDVMHFDPDPLTAQDLDKLRNVARMFDTLRNVRAF